MARRTKFAILAAIMVWTTVTATAGYDPNPPTNPDHLVPEEYRPQPPYAEELIGSIGALRMPETETRG
tara:strand:+ start:357 stop:560 length:204 start_codon:yes stop_codon:yes gene_type:complete